MTGGESPFIELGERYLRFAEHEAKGVSPLYEELARGVAGSEPLLRFISALPEAKQQPNLVFAAVRHLHGTPEDAGHLARLVEQDPEPVRRLVLARSTQTNEPGRCAVLLPVLARLPQPLALLEAGASAGLCLLPERYAYDYGRARLAPVAPGEHLPPVFPCRAEGATPIPERMPEIAWRAGIDLNPLDLSDPAEAAWLETLVWPGQDARAARLRAAMRIAAEAPPSVSRGDLLADLPALAATAPPDATLVIFHSAVLAYVASETRTRFAGVVKELGAVWISNEFPRVLPAVAAKLDRAPPEDRFLLAVDGEPVAFTGPHGQSIEWIATPGASG
ncbi:DUF2332 domain-containing protein [Longimicrobium sp.]|uniref:DUF2332 domain-containing protein n=1 Tax=Longimicrobium sp. TaxID=2029185 RepID=UPI002CE44D8B|nr:DUF2332 domain-containing protein [Longimicrobium sp.]HSU15594.1 DUF2332 domain-containing protein [Longimicrobium sp.]